MSLLFELERMERLAEDLNLLRRPVKILVDGYRRKDGKVPDGHLCPVGDWEEGRIGEPWNCPDSHRWYRITITIPESMHKKHVEFLITTGREGQWDATNPQMLFYLNGKLVQGVDVNHREILINRCAVKGEQYDIAILAYSGSVPGDLLLRTELVQVDDAVEKAYYDFLVPVQAARLLKKNDEENYRRLLVKLGPAADALDLRMPGSETFYRSIETMEEILKKEFYAKINPDAPVVSAVGHTHIDIAWLWTVEQTREKAIRSFSTVLELMDRYPNYRFMSSQPILYQFVKEQEPALYQRIKARIREGRWEVDGAMWLESDCNLPSGESLVRQIIKGEEFFIKEFGIPSKCLWLPDVFGYSAAIPQILKKCGIPYFMTTKIAWNQFNQLPNDTFIWKGIDGSSVFVFMPTACDYDKTLGLNISFTDTRNTTTYTGIVNPNMTLGTFKRFQNRDLTENTLMLFGFGDGGGGPTKEMLESAERLQYGLPGIPRLRQEGERIFFDRIHQEISRKPDMPVWDGELYFEYHRGTLTSMGKNKRSNRRNEMLYEQLETLGVMAEIHGLEYPSAVIEKGWNILLLNQFHDIIPGSAIKAVYDQTDMEYRVILDDGEKAAKTISGELGRIICGCGKERGESDAPRQEQIIVFNTQGYEREDVVEIMEPPGGDICWVEDGAGESYPVQYTNDNRMLFCPSGIPGAGYAVYKLTRGREAEPVCPPPWTGTFENPWYRAEFNHRLELISLVEKETGCEILKEGCPGNRLMSFEDRPMNWDNWDVDMYYRRKPYEADSSTKPVLKEWGPVRIVMNISHRFADSVVTQDVVMYHRLPRIDFKTHADWKNHHVLLRVHFPVVVNASKAAYEIQFGNVERETTSNHSWDTAKFEVCAHKWADLSENGMGISLLNDCKYGHSIKDGEMALTLIKSGIYPNEEADIGLHEFTYSIYPHKGRWQEARTVEMAYDLNAPLLPAVISGREVKKPWSMVTVDKKNCFVEMMKQAEDGDGYILRLYEHHNMRNRLRVTLGFNISSAEECDLLERLVKKLDTDGRSFEDFIKPYEIKTYRIRR